MRWLDIADAVSKLARHMGIESFKASDGRCGVFVIAMGKEAKSNVMNPVVLILVLLNLSH